MRSSRLVTLALLATLSASPCFAERFIPAGRAAGQVFEVDADSIARAGDAVQFRVRSRYDGNLRMDYEGLIAVDCVKRTRAEHHNSGSFGSAGSWSTAVTPEVRAVYDGTRQAQELDLVCGLARGTPPPAPAAPRSASAIVVSAQGHLVASDAAVEGCRRIEVVLGRARLPAQVKGRDRRHVFVLLKIDGGPYAALQPADAVPAQGDAVTLIGRAARAAPDADPAVAAGVVWESNPLQPRMATLSQSTLADGVVLDQRGAVVAWSSGAAVQRQGSAVTTTTGASELRAFLAQQGLDWPVGARGPALALPQLIRKGVSASAQVLCYTDG